MEVRCDTPSLPVDMLVQIASTAPHAWSNMLYVPVFARWSCTPEGKRYAFKVFRKETRVWLTETGEQDPFDECRIHFRIHWMNGHIHRPESDGPAVQLYDGDIPDPKNWAYVKMNLLHRTSPHEPALLTDPGKLRHPAAHSIEGYYRNGEEYREGGKPCVITKDLSEGGGSVNEQTVTHVIEQDGTRITITTRQRNANMAKSTYKNDILCNITHWRVRGQFRIMMLSDDWSEKSHDYLDGRPHGSHVQGLWNNGTKYFLHGRQLKDETAYHNYIQLQQSAGITDINQMPAPPKELCKLSIYGDLLMDRYLFDHVIRIRRVPDQVTLAQLGVDSIKEIHLDSSGDLHNETGPALVTESDSSRKWACLGGEIIRYAVRGLYHRPWQEGPTIESPTFKMWLTKGKFHRPCRAGPAMLTIANDPIYSTTHYLENGQDHNLHGPCLIRPQPYAERQNTKRWGVCGVSAYRK
jgi:hypothetical protein